MELPNIIIRSQTPYSIYLGGTVDAKPEPYIYLKGTINPKLARSCSRLHHVDPSAGREPGDALRDLARIVSRLWGLGSRDLG